MIQQTTPASGSTQPMNGIHPMNTAAIHRIPAVRPTLYPRSPSGSHPRDLKLGAHGIPDLDDGVDEPPQLEYRDEVEPDQSRTHSSVGRAHLLEQVLQVEQEEEPGQQEDTEEDDDADRGKPRPVEEEFPCADAHRVLPFPYLTAATARSRASISMLTSGAAMKPFFCSRSMAPRASLMSCSVAL